MVGEGGAGTLLRERFTVDPQPSVVALLDSNLVGHEPSPSCSGLLSFALT